MTTVSVIIPYYNQGKYLHAAVQSCLAAYSGDIEIIIVDDGSTESHFNHYCAQAQNLDPRVRVIRKRNGGLSSARNAGLLEARGEYVQFLDCDDALVPGKINQQVSQLISSKGKLVSISGYYISNEWFRDLRDESQTVSRFPFELKSFLYYWERGFTIPIHAGLFHRSIFEKIRFNEGLHGKEDWVFWSTVAGEFPGVMIFCPIVGAVYRLHGSSMTKSLDKMGEAWVKATRILSDQYSGEFPDFEISSDNWHRKFYRGGRSDLDFSNSSHPLNLTEVRSGDSVANPTATLIHSRAIHDEDKPTISFVIPVFNHSKYLRQCVSSVVNQGRDIEFEIVVIDDRSTEEEVIPILCDIDTGDVAYRVFLNDDNYGISITQNMAVQFARGDYIAFLDCDDYLDQKAVAELAGVISADEQPDYIFTDRNHVDGSGGVISRVNYGGYDWIRPSGSIEDDLLLGMIASHLKVIRKDLYQSLNGSNPRFSGVQDWDLALRLINKGEFYYLNKALYNHRIHENSVTNSGSITQFWMTNVIRRKYLIELSAEVQEKIDIDLSEISKEDIPEISRLFRGGVRFSYRSCEIDLSENQMNMIKEFNSYFDKIYLTKKDAAAIMGYMWDHNILHII